MGGLLAYWPEVSSALVFLLTLLGTGHALLHKREVRGAIGWVAIIWLVPFFGAVLYLLLGINRIQRRARALRAPFRYLHLAEKASAAPAAYHLEVRDVEVLADLAHLVGRVTSRPLLGGNRVQLLENGDEAYPAMLAAIEGARRSITLCTYIFDHDPVGRRFVEALASAVARGCEVRVLVDAAGIRYSFPAIDHALRRRGVTVARFLRTWRPWTFAYANLRNHRKVMVVDGELGFTGGMNVRHGHLLREAPPHPTRDLHFRVEGPVVTQLQQVFAEDWAFTTQERLEGEPWFAAAAAAGDTPARCIPDGPDEDLDAMVLTLLGAIACARRSVRVLTPYFLPDNALVAALNIAALRGVEVDIVLPEHGNLRVVEWAMWSHVPLVLGRGCRVWLTPPPFDHAKVMTVDGAWALIGSTNWDPRSLRLNFELNVECYDRTLAGALDRLIEQRIASARALTLDELARRPLWRQLRDAAARLASPYL